MADSGMVALREALGKILETEHADLLREGVALLYRELMEAEVAEQAGAERYERSEERLAYRNGYRPRSLNTRVGSIELAIPKLRSGSYFPSFLELRKRSEPPPGAPLPRLRISPAGCGSPSRCPLPAGARWRRLPSPVRSAPVRRGAARGSRRAPRRSLRAALL
jgi:hypothetical protein